MSSPVPSPVPAGTERDEWLMRDALRKIEVICGEAWSYRVPHDLASDVLRQLSVVGALLPPLAAVVSSSPATPEGEGVQVMLDLADGSRVVGVLGQHYEPPYYFWDDEAASSPATPEGWVCRDHGATMMCPEGCKTYRPREAWAAAPPASPAETREGRERPENWRAELEAAPDWDAVVALLKSWTAASPAVSLPGEQPGGETTWPTFERVVNFAMDDGEDPPAPALPVERADEEAP